MLAMTKPFLSAILKIIARSGSDVAISSLKGKNEKPLNLLFGH